MAAYPFLRLPPTAPAPGLEARHAASIRAWRRSPPPTTTTDLVVVELAQFFSTRQRSRLKCRRRLSGERTSRRVDRSERTRHSYAHSRSRRAGPACPSTREKAAASARRGLPRSPPSMRSRVATTPLDVHAILFFFFSFASTATFRAPFSRADLLESRRPS